MKQITVRITASVLTFLWGCRPASDVRVPAEWSVSAEPLLEIGEVEGDSVYLFHAITSARLLPSGQIVVADAGYSVVRVFEPDGRFAVQMGRSGEGPGEFRQLAHVWIIAPDTIGTWDPGSWRLTYFLSDGSFLRTQAVMPPSGAPPGLLEIFVGAFSDGAVALGWTVGAPRVPGQITPDRVTVGEFARDGAFVAMRGEELGYYRSGGSPLPFSPAPATAVFSDSVYVLDGLAGLIRVLDRDWHQSRRIEFPASPGGEGDPWQILRAQLEARDAQLYLRLLEEQPSFDSIPRLRGLLIDEAGYLWTKAYEPATDALWLSGRRMRGGHWWVAHSSGEVVGMVTLPEGIAPLDIRGDRMLGLAEDSVGIQRLAVFRVTRGS